MTFDVHPENWGWFPFWLYNFYTVYLYFSIGLKPPPTSSKSVFLRPNFCFLSTEKPWMTPAIATLRSIHPLRHRTRHGLHVTAPSTGRWGLYGKPKSPGSLKEVHLRKKHLGILVWIVWFGLCLRDYVSQVFFLQKPWIQDSYQATSTMEGSRATSIVFHCSEAQWILESNHYTSIKEHSRLENSPWREMYHSSQLFFSIAM